LQLANATGGLPNAENKGEISGLDTGIQTAKYSTLSISYMQHGPTLKRYDALEIEP